MEMTVMTTKHLLEGGEMIETDIVMTMDMAQRDHLERSEMITTTVAIGLMVAMPGVIDMVSDEETLAVIPGAGMIDTRTTMMMTMIDHDETKAEEARKMALTSTICLRRAKRVGRRQRR